VAEKAASTGQTLDHPLDRITAQLSRYPCSTDNRVRLLKNGEQAYPEMLDSIRGARNFVFLSTYIFQPDKTGREFIEVLSQAVKRGVTVRVLIDSIGSLYSYPSVVNLLRKASVPVSRFLPLFHRDSWLLNLRNHRKILAVDGNTAFTGGMNIGSRHLVRQNRSGSTADVQVRIDGSAAHSLASVFCLDWQYVTGEVLDISSKNKSHEGTTPCRPVSDGPDEELGTLPWLLLGLIGAANTRITIITPYFLLPPAIVGALIGATLRGVKVCILLPEKSNLPYVNWATEHSLIPILQTPIEVYFQPRPFSHTKMLLIDEDFLQIGSYNMDSRSLRLNFELAVNIYDIGLRHDFDSDLRKQIQSSRRISSEELTNKNLFIRIRNSLAWLFVPYL
jgi:cardiolipin synthase